MFGRRDGHHQRAVHGREQPEAQRRQGHQSGRAGSIALQVWLRAEVPDR